MLSSKKKDPLFTNFCVYNSYDTTMLSLVGCKTSKAFNLSCHIRFNYLQHRIPIIYPHHVTMEKLRVFPADMRLPGQ